MRVLVIPDCHLKPWMFEDATAIMNSGKADNAVCLMDIPDDFGKDNPDLYKKAYDAAIRFAKQFPQSLWCYGNHDLSYVWSKPETGFNPAVRMLVREKLEELERTLSSPSQLAYMQPVWYREKELDAHGIPTGRTYKACSCLLCEVCGHRETVDSSFDESYK